MIGIVVTYAANLDVVRTLAHRFLVLAEDLPAPELELDWELRGGARLGSPAVWQFVWSIIARDYDPETARLMDGVFGAKPGLSISNHVALWRCNDAPLADLLGYHPLHKLGFIVPREPGPTISTNWRVSSQLWDHVRGSGVRDPEIEVLAPVDLDTPLSEGQLGMLGALAVALQQTAPAVIVLAGVEGGGRTDAVGRVAGRPVVRLAASRVSSQRFEAACGALLREACLRDALPVISNLDLSRLAADAAERLGMLIAAYARPVVVTVDRDASDAVDSNRLGVALTRLDWPVPDAAVRRGLWRTALEPVGGLPEAELDVLAARYRVGSDAIRSITASAVRRSDGQATFGDVVAGVRDNISARLGDVARRVEVTERWDDLVLSQEISDDISMLVARVRHSHKVLHEWGFLAKLARSSGTAALFSGQPGTGKTMVAGLIANELQLDLYQIDLSRVVSKWVGETEKALARVFDAAEAGHALLLFDEADALFAKRSVDVKSAVDRYANLEVNYLLQRVERFDGVVILTTNLDTSLDPALRRRLSAHIVFAPPELEERRALWERMMTTHGHPKRVLDYDALAREFEHMTGANIRNAALGGAFLAAAQNTEITIDHLRQAARQEYRSMGHVLTKAL